MLNHAAAPYIPASEIGLAVPGNPVVPHHVSPSRKKFLASRKSPPESRPLELSPEIEALIDARIQQAQLETQKLIDARIQQSRLETDHLIDAHIQQSQLENRKFLMMHMIKLYVKNKDRLISHFEWLSLIAADIRGMSWDIRDLSKRIDTGTDW